MTDLLFLSHRIPYPPDKGEKIRAWHMLCHLSRTHRLHVGCFVDDAADWAHVERLRQHCVDLACFPIHKVRQKLRALARLRPGVPLTLAYYQDAGMRAWVDHKLAAGVSQAFVYCSAMAPYVLRADWGVRVLDMVDIDSEKWRSYGANTGFPARLFWQREASTLLAFERRAAAAFDRTIFVSRDEAQRFLELAPQAGERVDWIGNGVDLEFFAPGPFANPFTADRAEVVFVGTMDYWPNVNAVSWFTHKVLPLLRSRGVLVGFTIAGANPAPVVRRLARLQGVSVTGRVADVRPYVAHAALVVAPLRIGRGIQNKVLEAMAMGAAVVASPEAFTGIEARPGRDLLLADGAEAFSDRICEVLAGHHPSLGAAARRAMEARYEWTRALTKLDGLFPPGRASIPAMADPTMPARELVAPEIGG